MKNLIIPVLLIVLSSSFWSCDDTSVNGNPPGTIKDFPNSEGSFWEYKVTDSLNNRTDTVTVLVGGKDKLATGSDVTVWQLSFKDSVDSNYVLFNGDSVKIYEDKEFLMGNIKFVFPLKDGASWEGDYITDSFYVTGVTQVSVPAGNFTNVYIIERNYGGFNEYRKMTIWFVPEVGIIKIHRRDTGFLFENELRELTAYSIQ